MGGRGVASLYIYIRRRRMGPAGRDKSELPDLAFKVDTNIEFRLPPLNKSTGNWRYSLFYWFITWNLQVCVSRGKESNTMGPMIADYDPSEITIMTRTHK